MIGESNDRIAIVKEGLQAHEKVCLARPAPEQLTREAGAAWFTRLEKSLRDRIDHYSTSAPSVSLLTPDSVKTTPDFMLTSPDSLSADSVGTALNFNFALVDSLTADSVKSKVKVSGSR